MQSRQLKNDPKLIILASALWRDLTRDRSGTLTPAEQLVAMTVLGIMQDASGDKPQTRMPDGRRAVFLAQEDLAAMTGYKVRHIRDCLKRLVELGVLIAHSPPGGKRGRSRGREATLYAPGTLSWVPRTASGAADWRAMWNVQPALQCRMNGSFNRQSTTVQPALHDRSTGNLRHVQPALQCRPEDTLGRYTRRKYIEEDDLPASDNHRSVLSSEDEGVAHALDGRDNPTPEGTDDDPSRDVSRPNGSASGQQNSASNGVRVGKDRIFEDEPWEDWEQWTNASMDDIYILMLRNPTMTIAEAEVLWEKRPRK